MLKENLITADDIEKRYYFMPIKKHYEKIAKNVGYDGVLDYLTKIMESAKDQVDKIIKQRVNRGLSAIQEKLLQAMDFRDWLHTV